jgi:hypothetical protein
MQGTGEGIWGGFVECGCCQVRGEEVMWGWLVRMTKEARWQPAMAMAAGGSNLMLLTPSLGACAAVVLVMQRNYSAVE